MSRTLREPASTRVTTPPTGYHAGLSSPLLCSSSPQAPGLCQLPLVHGTHTLATSQEAGTPGVHCHTHEGGDRWCCPTQAPTPCRFSKHCLHGTAPRPSWPTALAQAVAGGTAAPWAPSSPSRLLTAHLKMGVTLLLCTPRVGGPGGCSTRVLAQSTA